MPICKICELEKRKGTGFRIEDARIIEFAKLHDWNVSFGEERKRKPIESEDYGLIELRMDCGCIITLGWMPDRTYHLHSIEVINKDTEVRETLFEV